MTKLHADLKIRLHYDEIKIKEFFNEIIKAYLEKNENIINFIEELKEQKQMSNVRRNKIKRANKNANAAVRQFSLNDEELENIFDIKERSANYNEYK